MRQPFDEKTVHLVQCPFCKTYHRVRLRVTSFGEGPTPENMPEMLGKINQLLESKPSECPATKKTFTADADDWLHLTEEEFHRRAPGSRSN